MQILKGRFACILLLLHVYAGVSMGACISVVYAYACMLAIISKCNVYVRMKYTARKKVFVLKDNLNKMNLNCTKKDNESVQQDNVIHSYLYDNFETIPQLAGR